MNSNYEISKAIELYFRKFITVIDENSVYSKVLSFEEIEENKKKALEILNNKSKEQLINFLLKI